MGEEGHKRRRLRLVLAGVLGAVLLVVGIGVGIFLATHGPAPVAQVPNAVAEQVLFPVYTTALPKGYSVEQSSFTVQEKTITFDVSSKSGQTIAITQQAKPDKFDYDAFYQQQMGHPKNLQDVPFPSVLGSVDGGTTLLSVVTDKAWILVNTKTAPEADMRFIAQHIRRQAP